MGDSPAKSPHTGPFAHKKIIFFARRRKQRKSLTSAVVQQLQLGLGMRRGHRRCSPWGLRRAGSWRCSGGQRESLRSPLEGRGNFRVTEPDRERERERPREKVFRGQINLKAFRRRAYLNAEGAIFQRVLRTCGLDTSGPKIDNLNDQAAHVACKRVKWSPASVRLYVMWYIMLDVNSPKP